MRQDKWYVNLYGSNDGRVYVGPLGATCGVAEVHTTAGREQALRDAEMIVDAVNSVDALREQNRVLTEALEAAKYELAALFPIPSAPTVHAALEVCGNNNEADARCIYLAYEAICAALTATSQPGGEG